MKKVLVAEDEESIREFIVINLTRSGYTVEQAENGAVALEKFAKDESGFDVAILDIMMPEVDGLAVCKQLRAKSSDLGIIMLSAKTQEMDKITGLMFGAEVDGELAGFIGMHTDGSVGMLEVFKKYRRCGVGSALVSHMNNYHADRGWTVYGQVYFDNDVSLAMQRRLGLAESEDYIRWISGRDTF